MPCMSSASVADGAPAGPDPDLPQLTQGCPPDPLQDAVSPLLGPCGPTSREQANREAGVAHSTVSTPQESASAHWELRAQPREHPTRCPPPGRPPDPTLNPLHGPFQAAEPLQNPPELRQAKCADINSESPGVSVPQRPQAGPGGPSDLRGWGRPGCMGPGGKAGTAAETWGGVSHLFHNKFQLQI